MPTGINWSDETWNPVTGCSVVSAGCTNCYAMALAGSFLSHMPQYDGLIASDAKKPVWNGEVRFNRSALAKPLHWTRPRRIFVNSMGDLFHESVPFEWIDEVFDIIKRAPHHIYQILTKRPLRMQAYIGEVQGEFVGRGQPLAPHLRNVHLGVSVESQRTAVERIPTLLATPASVRWVSAEPLLEGVRLDSLRLPGANRLNALTGVGKPMAGPEWFTGKLDWVVCGGESGSGARPMNPIWALTLRDQCARAGVSFHFKQWGEWFPGYLVDGKPTLDVSHDADAADWKIHHWRHVTNNRNGGRGYGRVGKKRAGRRLAGAVHDERPAVGDD